MSDPFLSSLPKFRVESATHMRGLAAFPEYSASYPTGVTVGKTWMRHDGAFDPDCDNPIWLLCAYESHAVHSDRCIVTAKRLVARVQAFTDCDVTLRLEEVRLDKRDEMFAWFADVMGYRPKTMIRNWDEMVVFRFRTVKDAIAFRMVEDQFLG